MTIRTPEQKRARHALACVKRVAAETWYGKYVQYAKSLPAAVLTNGLGQALASEAASTEQAHKMLADHVAQWLLSAEARVFPQPTAHSPDGKALLDRIVESNQQQYVRAQAEALAYLGWLKRFASAFLDEDHDADAAQA